VVEQTFHKKMRDGRAKECEMAEQKLNKKCNMSEQKKCKMVEQTFHKKMQGGRAKECEMAEQKNARWPNRS
jgi:hypothetical protein